MAAKVAAAVVSTTAIAAGAYYAYTVSQKNASTVPPVLNLKAAAAPPAPPAVLTPAKPPDATSDGSTAVAVNSMFPGLSPEGVAVYQAALTFQPPSTGPLGQKLMTAVKSDPDSAAILASARLETGSSPTPAQLQAMMDTVTSQLKTHYGPKYGPVISLAVRTSIAEELQILARPVVKEIAAGDHKSIVAAAARSVMASPVDSSFAAFMAAIRGDPDFMITLSNQPASFQADVEGVSKGTQESKAKAITAISPIFAKLYPADADVVTRAFSAVLAYGYNLSGKATSTAVAAESVPSRVAPAQIVSISEVAGPKGALPTMQLTGTQGGFRTSVGQAANQPINIGKVTGLELPANSKAILTVKSDSGSRTNVLEGPVSTKSLPADYQLVYTHATFQYTGR